MIAFGSAGCLGAPGELVVGRDDGGRLHVLRSDPRIWIGCELLSQIDAGPPPDVCLVRTDPDGGLVGAVLTVDAVNQRVIYRVLRHLLAPDVWEAEWPD